MSVTDHAVPAALDRERESRFLLGRLRAAGAMPWLGQRSAYTLGAPLLTLAGAAATILAPLLLDPMRFGDYALLLCVFQYACTLDLGLSQLTDRALAAREDSPASVANLVWARLAVGALVLVLCVPLALALARLEGDLTAGNLWIAAAGGVAFMLSNGPVALYRAGSRVWEFTLAALSMQAGLSLPRLVGLAAGGVTGCYAALAAFYALTAAMLHQPFAEALRQPPPLRALLRTLGRALPLFAFTSLWLLYLTANRWVAATLAAAEGVGLFAFGANLVAVGIGMLSTIGQVHYPKHLAGRGDAAARLRLGRELLRLVAAATAGTLAGVIACRYAIPAVFPNFAAAAAPAAMLMASGIPLSLAGWLMPLLVASSRRPWWHAAAMFAPSFVMLGVLMAVGDGFAALVGQAGGASIAALVPAALQLLLLRRAGMLGRSQVAILLAAAAIGMGLDGLAWAALFGR